MPLDYQHILEQDGLADKPVLLSERTQQIVISTLDFYLRRAAWDEMPDTTWDDLDASLADAITEILTIQELPEMTITNLGLQRTSNVSTSTFPYIVPFDTGSGYDSGNPTRLTPSEGNVVIQANIHFTAGSANVGYVEIRKNIGIGTVVLARHDLSGVTTNYVNLSAIDVADSDDFYELVIQSNVPITIQAGTFFPKLECKVFA